MPLIQIAGPRGGIVFHNGDGFIYKRQKTVKGVTYFICGYKRCTSRGTLRSKKHIIKVTKKHDHPPDLLIPAALELRQKILQRCRDEKKPCKVIFNEEISRMGHLAKHEFIRGMGAAMHRARFSACPPIPDSLLGYKELKERGRQLSKYTTTLNDEPWLLDVIVTTDGDQTAIFMPPSMKKLMHKASEFHIDASFKFVPDYPSCEVFTVISAIYREHAFPAVYLLMSKQTKVLYVAALHRVLQEVPGWSPRTILSDYEVPLLYALQEVFSMSDHTSIHGCWFQFTQVLWRKRRSMKFLLGSNPVALKAAQMAMVLPTLPSFVIHDGLEEVIQYLTSNLEGDLLDHMLEFLEYVEEWIKCIGPDTLSVETVKDKSMFSMHQFHRCLMGHLRSQQNFTHPKFWQFIYAIQRVESEKSLMLEILEEQGFESGRSKRRDEQLQERSIELNMRKLRNGLITMREYLLTMSSRVFKPFLWNTGIEARQNDQAPELGDEDDGMEVTLSSEEGDDVLPSDNTEDQIPTDVNESSLVADVEFQDTCSNNETEEDYEYGEEVPTSETLLDVDVDKLTETSSNPDICYVVVLDEMI